VSYREKLKQFSSEELHAAPNRTIFSVDHPQDKEIQVCSNKDPGVIYGLALGI